MNDLNAFTGLVRRCVEDYDMIAPGDTVAVGVSGGKDSLVLLLALNELRRYYPKPFSLEAITVELGFEGMDFAPVAELCASLGVPYTRLKTDIKEVVFDVRKEDNPCSLCAKMRRGALCTALSERGITKLARVKQDKPGGDSPPGLCVEMKSQRTFWQKRMTIAAVCARVASPFGSRVVTPLALPTPQITPCATAQDIGVRA